MLFGRGVRSFSTQTAQQTRYFSNRKRAAVLITIAAGTSYLVIRPIESNSQQPRQFSDVNILSSTIVPLKTKAPFDPHEKLVHRILRISMPPGSNDTDERIIEHPFSIYSYYVKEPSLQIERPYTPLDSPKNEDTTYLSFLIKRYKEGEMSRYLHRLSAGASVPIRGPVPTWSLDMDSVPEEIVMLVAGTGVSTAAQLLSTLRSSCMKQLPKITVLYAAQSLDSLQCVPELGRYQKEYPEVKVGVWVENISSTQGYLSDRDSEPIAAELHPIHKPRWWWSSAATQFSLILADGTSMPLTLGRMHSTDLQKWIAQSKNQVILVCGPDGFVREMAGEKGRDQVSQGPLSGILGSLGYSQSQVTKF